jgi:tripartite-type tricarboxylate transporter receptor subunit TctC
MQDLVGVARSRPGVLNYGTIGAASPQGLTMEWFKRLAQIDIVPVPYKGVGPALTAVISGEVQTMAAGLAAGMAQVQGGKLRALAVTSATRSAVAPDVPTVAEAGYPGFDVFTWYGIMLPAGTPPAIVAKLNSDLLEVLSAPEVRARFIANGVESAPLPPAEFAQFIKANSELWAGIIKQAGVKPE